MKSGIKSLASLAAIVSMLVCLPLHMRSAGQSKESSAPLQTKARKDEVVARLERDIPQLMKDGGVPGLSIALIRDGEVVWHRGFGVKNSETKEAVDETTVFEAASLSKPVFAYAVMKLVESGKLDLDKPLNQYLPGNYDVGDDARLNQITARQVLSHTTGFPNWRGRDETTLKIYFTPGERFSYSGEGVVYLAKVVEHITGEEFNAFMKRMVFDPLGMNDSSYVWRDSYERSKIYTHNSTGIPLGQNKVTKANPAASLQTTAQDYGRFVAAILKGTGLRKETRGQMLTPQIRVGEGGTNTVNKASVKLSESISWGLGVGLQSTPDGLSFWHWGDNGNTKAYVVGFDKQRLGVVVFTNSANGLSIMPEIIKEAVGGSQPALAWLNYESYKSPARLLFKSIVAEGAAKALGEYREWRKGRAPAEAASEAQMNRVGYELLGMKRIADAIEVFKQNVEDYPQSFNAYDSLGEAYLLNGDKELAIKNYQRSVELNPDNRNGVEALQKLLAK